MATYYNPWKMRPTTDDPEMWEVYNANTDKVVGRGDPGTANAFMTELNFAYSAHINRGGTFTEEDMKEED